MNEIVDLASGAQTRRARTREILAEIAETDLCRLRDGDRLREDLGFDSLRSLELLSVVADELRIDLPMEEALELRTVDDACAFVEKAWRAGRDRRG